MGDSADPALSRIDQLRINYSVADKLLRIHHYLAVCGSRSQLLFELPRVNLLISSALEVSEFPLFALRCRFVAGEPSA
jgi:hypothetical protein